MGDAAPSWTDEPSPGDVRADGRDALFHAIAEVCPTGIFATDAKGRCLFANDRWQEIAGLPVPACYGEGWATALDPEDRDRVFREWADAVATAREFSLRFRFRHADGSRRNVQARARAVRDGNGVVTGFVGTVEDITRRLAAESALRESEARLARVLAGSNDGYWEWDLRTDRVERSPSFLAILGFDENGLPGRSEAFFRLLHVDDGPAVRSAIRDLLEGRVPSFEAEVRMRRADGRWIWVLDRGRVTLRDIVGRPLRVSGTIIDIDERVRGREAIAAARDAAMEADRTKSEFLANVSHEIRTPLHGVLGMAELLVESPLTDDQRDQAETIRRSGTALLSLVNDILEFSRLGADTEPPEDRELDVREVVEDTLRSVGADARMRGLDLTGGVDGDVPPVLRGDRLRLRRVLLHLCDNGVKFTERGSVSLRASVASRDGDGILQLRFTVSDTGIGIPPEQQASLFEPFRKVDGSMTRRQGGSGLGLTLVRGMVEAWRGTVSLDSVVGRGTTVAVTLPVREAAAPPGEAREREAPGDRAPRPAPAGGRLLLAEDHPVNRKVLVRMAERLGYAVVAVENGEEAVRAVREGSFDAVLMDCQMPLLDGYDATRRIRAAETGGRRLPIVAVTAHAMAGDRERALECGMDDYLAKPVGVEELRDTLARLLAPKP